MRARGILSIIVIVLSIVDCWGQKPDLRFQHINSLDGLSHGFTRKVIQDHKGYMWFATADGLNKYDGYKMSVYKTNPDNSNSISSNDVLTLFEDSDHNLWIGTSKGVNLYNRDMDNFIRFPEIGDSFITSFLEDREKLLWVSSKKRIYHFNKKGRTFEKYNLSADNLSFYDLYQDSNNTFWVATFEGMAILDKASHTLSVQQNIPVNDISSIHEDKHKNLWIGSRVSGLMVYNLLTKSTKLYQKELKIPNNAVLAVNEDTIGRIWIGTENGGLVVFDPSINSFYHFKNNPANPESLSFNTIYSIYADKARNMWLGTYAGVEQVKSVKFAHIRQDYLNKNSLGSNNILSFCEDKSGNLWIGTDGEGLDEYNPRSGVFTHYRHDPANPKSISSNAVTYLKEDSEGNLWVGTWGGGLNLFDRKSKEFRQFKYNPKDPSSIQNNNVAHIYEDKRGNLWVGIGNGLELLDKKSMTFIHYNYMFSNTLLSSYPGDILEDNDGNFWVATFDGLCIFDRDKRTIETFLHSDKDKNSISNNVIYTLFESQKGELWIGTVGGLNKFNKETKTFESFHVKDGLPSDAIYGILEDNKGLLWISTSSGISQFNPSTKIFKNYKIDDGLQGNEFNLNAFLKLNNGDIVFGGNNGFNQFNPNIVMDNKFAPSIVITDFKIFNKSVPIGADNSPLKKQISELKEVEISYKNSVISFEFAALSYSSPESNQYAYKLVGLEKEWNYVGNKREATYTNLDPGSYTFIVKGSNNDGVWNEKGTSLSIIISPPFWKAWWFKVLLFLTFIILVNVFIRLRINRYRNQKEVLKRLVQRKTSEIIAKNETLQKANQELSKQKEEIINQKNEILEMSQKVKEVNDKKLEFFTNISHEIRTPLTLILGPVERLKEKSFTEPAIGNEVNILYKNAHRLLNLVNELIDFNKMDNGQMKVMVLSGDIIRFCSEIVEAFREFAQSKQIKLLYSPKVESFNTWFDPGKIEVVLFNLISNAFKFTSTGGEISVTLEVKEGFIDISVRDNGIGIEKDKLEKIFDRYYQIESSMSLHHGTGLGLAFSKELIDIMGGDIKALSTPGYDTTFTVTLPILSSETINNSEKYLELPQDSFALNYQFMAGLVKSGEVEEDGAVINGGNTKILVVDDNDDLRKYIRTSLGQKFAVIEAKNGKEGLAAARTHSPKLIISDVMMPEMDGIEFCYQVKEDIEISHIPVILLTAKTNIKSRIEGYGKGADDYMTKPFSKEALIARIENLIQNREKLREVFKSKISLDPQQIVVSSADERFLKKAMEIVESNIHDSEFGVGEFVYESGMSRSLVYTKLKELIDLSPAEFIKTTRLKRACQLLKEKKHRISEVCYMVGFTDPHYFTISFKKLYGKTPTEYIEEEELR